MQIQSFFILAKECIFMVSIILLFLGIFFLIWYLVQKKRQKEVFLNWKKIIVIVGLLGYLIVVFLATIFTSRYTSFKNTNLQPFSSYLYAWNNFDFSLWLNIILNVLMFIPLGFLLPLINQRLKKWWLTYLTGLLLTITIEITQYISKRGILETDDIINNLLGCMIGYGLWAVINAIYLKVKKQDIQIISIILKQIPLLLTIITFITIFTTYNCKQLGNIRQNYYKYSKEKIINEANLSNEKDLANVYQIKINDESEYVLQATNIFDQHHLQIDETLTEKYDDTIIYYSKDQEASISIDSIDGTYSFNNYKLDSDYATNLDLNQIKQVLAKYKIEIPEATFTNFNSGQYEIKIDSLIDHDKFKTGSIVCFITKDLQLKSIEYRIKTYTKLDKYNLISSYEAYQLIKSGKFNSDYLEYVDDKIVIKSVKLKYLEDTKGYLQPVYEFYTNGKGIIYIPAIK